MNPIQIQIQNQLDKLIILRHEAWEDMTNNPIFQGHQARHDVAEAKIETLDIAIASIEQIQLALQISTR